jgi:hypothetical protein
MRQLPRNHPSIWEVLANRSAHTRHDVTLDLALKLIRDGMRRELNLRYSIRQRSPDF